ncbi:hypothetical protein MKW92_003767 [Papaver armeniacum]|nr:hypothetical protein MKW92_003767 [Papaver armeniacum]
MITKGISIICKKHGGLNVADIHNYSQCSTSSSEVSTPRSQLASTHPHGRYMIKCTKTYSNLLISFLNEIANSLCLGVFTVFLVITKIVIHIVVASSIVHREMHHRQTTRTAISTTSVISLEEQEEGGGVRLSLSDIQNLSSFEYEMGVEPAQDCIVCLEVFIKGETCRSLQGCNHVFHASCVDSWLIQVPSCPLCRQIVVTPGANQLICTAGES